MTSISIPNNAHLPAGSHLLVSARDVSTFDVVDPLTGKTYAVTVEKIDSSGRATNITGRRDWLQTAQEVIKVLNDKADKRAFISGAVTLQGEFSDIEQREINIDDRQVSIVTAEVKYKQQDDAPSLTVKTFSKQQDTLSDQQQTTVFRTLRNLSDSLVVSHTKQELINNAPGQTNNIQPNANPIPGQPNVSAQPHAPGQQQPDAHYENVTEYDTVKICEGRAYESAKITGSLPTSAPIEKYTPCYALAAQLSKMKNPGQSQFSGEPVQDIAIKIAHRAAQSMIHQLGDVKVMVESNNYTPAARSRWLTENLENMRNSLNEASKFDSDNFNISLQRLKSLINKPGKEKLSDGDFGIILTKQTLDDKDKALLAGVYIAYAGHPDSTFTGDIFFNAFVHAHRSGGSRIRGDQYGNECYQIVVIEEDKGKQIPPKQYLAGANKIQTGQCAFLHFDKQTGIFSSYDRSRGDSELLDLNQPNQISSEGKQVEREKASPPPTLAPTLASVQTIEIDSSGQCLDSSLAYQILTKARVKNLLDVNANRAHLDALAGFLRTQAANIIWEDNTLNSDKEFMHRLVTSLGNIPNIPEEIKQLITRRTHTPSSTDDAETEFTKDEKDQLREHYANYIIGNNKKNSLDSAFLYVVPKIDFSDLLLPDRKVLPTPEDGFNIAVVQGEEIIDNFSKNNPFFDLKDTLFVNYNRTDHFTAVDMNHPDTKNRITNMIHIYINKAHR
ncbi:MAG: hypothetical protein WA347_04060 [Rhabdochlamydiaceae bacterium]